MVCFVMSLNTETWFSCLIAVGAVVDVLQRAGTGDLTGRAKDEQLVGAVLDLAGNEQLEALDIHLIVLSERSRHCYPGALEIHHDNSLTFKKLKMCIAKSRNALVALKNVISFPA